MTKAELIARALDPNAPALTPAERAKLFRRVPKDRGHAAPPGTGPDGETCGTCEHYVRRETEARRVYRKCGRMEAQWTGGLGTDIRAKDKACSQWEARSGDVRTA
jgi:hypothetical protein